MNTDKKPDQRTGRPVKTTSANGPTAAEYRLAQQKAALKANMARRKAQVRVSGEVADLGTVDETVASTATANTAGTANNKENG